MHESLLKCKCDAMHDNLKPFKKKKKKNQPKDFVKNLSILKKPQKFSKTPKVRSENMKCMIEWVKIDHTRWRKWSLDQKAYGFEV